MADKTAGPRDSVHKGNRLCRSQRLLNSNEPNIYECYTVEMGNRGSIFREYIVESDVI